MTVLQSKVGFINEVKNKINGPIITDKEKSKRESLVKLILKNF